MVGLYLMIREIKVEYMWLMQGILGLDKMLDL